MSDNPLQRMVDEGLADRDFAVLRHGFAPHGRDYVLLIEDGVGLNPGTYRLILTHVVELSYITRVGDSAWTESWDNLFTDYGAWLAAGEPPGYVFGTKWSGAFPGLSFPQCPKAQEWSRRLKHPMYAARIETDLFKLTIVYSHAHLAKLSEETPTSDSVIFRL